MIIAAYAGTGKTTFAKLCPQAAIDLVCMPNKYLPRQDHNNSETCKADPDNIIQDDWPFNYVSAIKQALGGGKLLLIPTDWLVLGLLREEKLPYILCYPEKNAKEAYRKRFLDRGNTAEFIDIFIGRWNEFIESFERDSYGQHIVLKQNQFLSDVINH